MTAESELRSAVRTFLDQELAAQTFTPTTDSWVQGHSPEFSGKLGERGWLGMTWPKRYGGQERSAWDRFVIIEELLAAGAPVAAHWIADRQTGPLLTRFGTEEQREFFLPRIAAGELFVSAGLSEPDSGSDLASVRTRAEKVDGGWTVTGHKIWTSHAHRSQWLLALVRTAPPEETRHAGLSQVLIDLSAPGVEVRPIRVMGGDAHFTEIVLDGVHVPDSRVVGEVGAGWQQVTSELAYERSGPERYLSSFPLFVELLRETPLDDRVASEVGSVAARLWALRALSMQVQVLLDQDRSADVAAALVKDVGTRLEQEVVEIARRVVADLPGGPPPKLSRLLEGAQFAAPTFSLRGGTGEILRGIIAKGLGKTTHDHDALHDAVAEVIADQIEAARTEATEGGFAPSLWTSVCDGGFATVAAPEDAGGSGGTLADLATILRVSGFHGAPIPLAESNVAALVLARAGLSVPEGPVTVADLGEHNIEREEAAGEWRATGTMRAVPWAGPARSIAVFGQKSGETLVSIVSTAALTLTPGVNLAGEPTADVALPADGVALTPVPADPHPYPGAARDLLTLARALLITGSLRRVLELTVQYSREREQFGRPIAAFQAVGHQLAQLAGAVEQADAIVETAVDELASGEPATDVVLAAKICTGAAADVAIRVGHQVHGAIGVTEEHELHHHTRRLMAWRDQGGSEVRAALELGRRITDGGAECLWELLTNTPRRSA